MHEQGECPQRRWGSGRLVLAAAMAALLALASCGSESPVQRSAATEGVRIASFDFTESELIAELYGLALEHRGIPVTRVGSVGPREVVAPAQERGLIDLVPEYRGSLKRYYDAASSEVWRPLSEELSSRGLLQLDAAPAENGNVVAVRIDTATKHGLGKVSDLREAAPQFRFGGPVECPDRPLCLIGLERVYGLRFAEFVPHRSLAVTADALRRHEVEVGLFFSTSAELLTPDFKVLIDDLGLQPDEFVVPVVRQSTADRWGLPLEDAIDSLSAELTTSDLQQLNQRIADGEPIDAVAKHWFETRDWDG